MADDPTKQFSKPVDVKQPRIWEDIVRDQGKAKAAFVEAQREKDETAKEQKAKESEISRKPPVRQKNFDMPGPGGAAVRNSVERENLVRRVKVMEAKNKAQGLENDAKRQQAGKVAEFKRVGAARPTAQSNNGKSLEGRALDNVAKAQSEAHKASLSERVNRLKVAEQGRDLVKSKGEYEK